MTAEGQRVSTWKVLTLSRLHRFCRANTGPTPTGDVTLSAEDMAPTSVSHPYSAKQPPPPAPPVDFEGDDDLEEGDEDDFYPEEHEEEDRHYWLHLPTAAKFLLAGGVAGAGELIYPKCLTPSGPLTLAAQYRERAPRRSIVSRYS